MPLAFFRTDSTAGGDGTQDRTDGATRAYPSMGSAVTSEQADLTGNGVLTLRCTIAGADTAAVTINGYTTTADDYLLIECTGDARHNGVSREKSGAGYQVDNTSNSTIISHEDYVRMIGIEAINSGATTLRPLQIDAGGPDLRYDDCIFGRTDVTVGTNFNVLPGTGTHTWTNCLFYAGGQRNDHRVGTHTFDHCGFTSVAVFNVVCDNSSTITNSWAINGTSESFWTGGSAVSGSHNASDDASVSTDFANSVASFTEADEFTSPSNALSSADFTLKDSNLNAAGTGSLATDIADTTRTGTADIGVFEFAAAGGATPKGPLGLPLHGPLAGPI